MPKDYEVYQPSNERLAQVVVGILEGKGYSASYQIGYPNNKVFIKANTEEEANKVSETIRKFMQKQDFGETGIPTPRLNSLTSKLSDLLPQPLERKEIETLTEKVGQEQTNILIPQAPKLEPSASIEMEELKSIITQRIKMLNDEMVKHKKDRMYERKMVEIDTLNWVLRMMI
jgi:hypothetical protein